MKRFSGRLCATIAVAVIVAMVSQVAVAQNEKGRRDRGNRGGGPGGQGGPVSMARLATIDTVQDALKLTDEQKAKIDKINNEARAEMRKEFQSGGPPDREKMRKSMEATSSKLNEVLDAGQKKRLMGILIQVNGAGAVMDPAVAKELKITGEQKTKLREAMESMRGGGRDQSPEARKEKMDKSVMAVLTTEQQQKLDSLKGEKVDIDMSKLRGPGGGREGRGERRGKKGGEDTSEKKSAA